MAQVFNTGSLGCTYNNTVWFLMRPVLAFRFIWRWQDYTRTFLWMKCFSRGTSFSFFFRFVPISQNRYQRPDSEQIQVTGAANSLTFRCGLVEEAAMILTYAVQDWAVTISECFQRQQRPRQVLLFSRIKWSWLRKWIICYSAMCSRCSAASLVHYQHHWLLDNALYYLFVIAASTKKGHKHYNKSISGNTNNSVYGLLYGIIILLPLRGYQHRTFH